MIPKGRHSEAVQRRSPRRAHLQSDFPAYVRAIAQCESPLQVARALNPNSLVGNDVNRSAWKSKTMPFVRAQIHFMIAFGNRQRLRQFSGTGTKSPQIMNSTPPPH
jgi:hypothetical protein